MACISPVTFYYSAKVNPSGKRSLVYSSRGSLDGKPYQRPCGQCVNCRIQTTADMTVRLVHESKCHNANSYLTLTYSPENLPADGSLVHRDFQLFAKRLREVTGSFKRYMCGEYGDENDRPHYHSIMFGVHFEDRKFYKYNKNGDPLYRSDQCNDLWRLGHVTIGDVELQSCRYVAGYIQKKIYGEKAADWYMGRKPEYAAGSNGLGLEYLRKYGSQWMENGFITLDGSKFRIPRYYDLKYKDIDSRHYDEVKHKRGFDPNLNPHELDGSFNRFNAVSTSISARLTKRDFDDET